MSCTECATHFCPRWTSSADKRLRENRSNTKLRRGVLRRPSTRQPGVLNHATTRPTLGRGHPQGRTNSNATEENLFALKDLKSPSLERLELQRPSIRVCCSRDFRVALLQRARGVLLARKRLPAKPCKGRRGQRSVRQCVDLKKASVTRRVLL